MSDWYYDRIREREKACGFDALDEVEQDYLTD
jgi:hypothetical protein